MVLHVTSKG